MGTPLRVRRCSTLTAPPPRPSGGGTVITIAGVYAVHPLTAISYSNLKEIVVTADAPLSAGKGTINIYPPLFAVGPFRNVSALPPDNALITIVRTAAVEWGLGANWPEPVLPMPKPAPVLVALDYNLQIRMAAESISGTLLDWSILRAALEARGFHLPPETPALVLRTLCRDLLDP